MDTNVFCVLCGNSFDLEHHIYNIDPQTEAYQVASTFPLQPLVQAYIQAVAVRCETSWQPINSLQPKDDQQPRRVRIAIIPERLLTM